MTTRFAGWDERTLALAIGEATEGLAREDRAELASRADERDLEQLEFAVAELNVAALCAMEPPPVDLMRRVADEARAWLAGRASEHPPPPSTR